MLSNSHLLEQELVSNAEGESRNIAVKREANTGTKEEQVSRIPKEEEKAPEEPLMPSTEGGGNTGGAGFPSGGVQPLPTGGTGNVTPISTGEEIATPMPTTPPMTSEPDLKNPEVVVNVDTGKDVPVMIDPVVGVGAMPPMMGGVGGGSGSRSEEEEAMPMEEEGGSNWWIWVALGGTAVTAWLVFRKKK